METITSLNNNRIVMYSKLKDKKYRDEYKLFLLENYKLIVEAIKRGENIESIIILDEYKDKFPSVIKVASDKIIIVNKQIFSKLSDTVTSQGIIAIIKIKDQISLSSLSGKTLVLDRLQDAGNVGTLLRSAQGFGFENIVLIDSVDIYNTKVIRSSGGSIFSLNFIKTSEKELLFEIKKNNFAVFVADMNGENLYTIEEFPANLMLVIGNEGQGVSSHIEESATNNIMVPMSKNLESLNAAVSGSIIMSYISSKNLI